MLFKTLVLSGLFLVALLVVACGGGDSNADGDDGSVGHESDVVTGESTSAGPGSGAVDVSACCDKAFAAVAAVGDFRDIGEDLHTAVVACQSIDEWVAASERNPGAIADFVDPQVFFGNSCVFGDDMATTRLCTEYISRCETGGVAEVDVLVDGGEHGVRV